LGVAKILVADDELSMREFLEILLKKEGHKVASARDGEEALSRFQKDSFDLVLSDIKMPKLDGLELLRKIKELRPNLGVIMITAFASPEDAITAMKAGAYDYLTKPFKLDEIKSVIRNALARPAGPAEEKAPPGVFCNLVSHSPEMLKIFALIRQVGPTKTNVLISGESGTGKELVARAIHRNSPRDKQPFVTINCSAIPDNLMESELFGHVKGAFTGAVAGKKGLFEMAHGGTIFLDEIGDLSPVIQVKLLRVIQEREFMRVGDTENISVDVRLISATNKNLEQEVIRGKFREDLNVVHLHLPALRERREDIPLLAQHFLEKCSRELGKDVRSISSYALDILMKYRFPGNVRELENIIERSVALENSNIILPDSLALAEHKNEGKKENLKEGIPPFRLTPAGIDLEKELSEVERDVILQALALSHGVIKKAGELLNLSFRSMRWKIQKYGLRGYSDSKEE
jgi:two-component system, NtrC family, response regulator PilR